MQPQTSRLRSAVKAITWRVTGTLDTFVISWVITGSPAFAGTIALTEVATKMVLYYLHERAWDHVSWGMVGGTRRAGEAVPASAPAS